MSVVAEIANCGNCALTGTSAADATPTQSPKSLEKRRKESATTNVAQTTEIHFPALNPSPDVGAETEVTPETKAERKKVWQAEKAHWEKYYKPRYRTT